MVYFESTLDASVKPVLVGTGRVTETSEYSATVEVDGSALVEPGYLVRFEVPQQRLGQPPPAESAAAPRAGPAAPETAEQLRARLAQSEERLEQARADRLRLQQTLREAETARLSLTRRLFEEQVADLETQLQQTDTELQRSNADRRNSSARLDQAQSALTNVGARLEAAELDRSALESERNRLNGELESLRVKVAGDRNAFEADGAQLRQQIRKLETRSSELEVELAEREQTIGALTTELEGFAALRDSAAELVLEKNELDAQLTTLAKLLANAENVQLELLAERDQAVEELAALIADKDRRVAELDAQLEALEARLAAAESGRVELLSQRDRLSGELESQRAGADSERQELQAKGLELQRKIDSLDARAADLDRELAAKQRIATELRDQRDQLVIEAEAQQKTIATLTQEVEELEVGSAESAAQIAAGNDRLAELDSLETRLAAAETSQSEMRGERERLAFEVETLRTSKAAGLDEQKATRAELQQQIDSLAQLSDGFSRELAAREETIDRLTRELETLRAAGRRFGETTTEQGGLLAELRATLADLESRNLEARQFATATGNRNTELGLRLHRARAMIAELNRRLDEQARASRPPSVATPATPPENPASSTRPDPPALTPEGSTETLRSEPEPSSPASPLEPARIQETVRTNPGAGSPATRIERIVWQLEGNGVAIVIYFDGVVDAEDCEVSRVREGQPRDVLKVRGIRESFEPSSIEIPTDLVHRIRTGRHSIGGGSELHIVFDLAEPNAGIRSVSVDSKTLVVSIS